MQGLGWPACRVGERVGDGVALSHTSQQPVHRAELEGWQRRKSRVRRAAFCNYETQLAGMLPQNHRRSRLRGFFQRCLRTEPSR